MWELAEWRFLNLCTDDPWAARKSGFRSCLVCSHAGPGATSAWFRITSRHSDISGERPHTALSDVGDPTERHAPARLFARKVIRRCSAPSPHVGYVRFASPDLVDSISLTPNLAKTAGRIFPSDWTPDPRFFWSSSSSIARASPSSRCAVLGSWATAASRLHMIL